MSGSPSSTFSIKLILLTCQGRENKVSHEAQLIKVIDGMLLTSSNMYAHSFTETLQFSKEKYSKCGPLMFPFISEQIYLSVNFLNLQM